MNRNYKLYVHIAPNGKKYYGITKQKPKDRWQNGIGYKFNQYFTKAINKYGWDNIEHIVIYDDLTEDEAKKLEQYYIQWYDTTNHNHGYNISLGGEGGNASEETRKKISNALKGEKHPLYGKTGKDNPNYGRLRSEETRRKISEALIGKNNPKARNVICITTNEVFGATSEAGRYYNLDSSSIGQCCRSKRKSAGKLPDGTKLVWRYIDIIEL